MSSGLEDEKVMRKKEDLYQREKSVASKEGESNQHQSVRRTIIHVSNKRFNGGADTGKPDDRGMKSSTDPNFYHDR